jgi:hypothetical protein
VIPANGLRHRQRQNDVIRRSAAGGCHENHLDDFRISTLPAMGAAPVSTWEFSGLMPGKRYDVYVMRGRRGTWARSARSDRWTFVGFCGGGWLGAYVHEHALQAAPRRAHRDPGTLTIDVETAGGDGALSIQIVDVTPPGMIFCTNTNSLGCLPSIGGERPERVSTGLSGRVRERAQQQAGPVVLRHDKPAICPSAARCGEGARKRTLGQPGGNPPPSDCSSVLDRYECFRRRRAPGFPLPALAVPGTLVDCQWWGRDPGLQPVTLRWSRYSVSP